MKKLFIPLPACFFKLSLVVALLGLAMGSARAVSTTVVISQIYGGGGNSLATYQNDYVELYNVSGSPVSINGWSVQYSSAAGTFGGTASVNTVLPNATIPAGGYFLVKLASTAAVGALLPTADFTNTSMNMSGTAGKVALANVITGLGTVTSLPDARIIDFVAYGGGTSVQEGGLAAPGFPNNTTADFRTNNGCTDTDVNTNDFFGATPAPRSSATPVSICGAAVGPAVTTAPQNISVGDGGTTNFSVTATGTAPLYYQWLRSGTNYNAISTSSTLTFSPAALTDSGTYSVVVSNTVSTATSATATLTVNAVGPTITAQPVSVVASAGTNAVFSVTATGSATLTYQWKKNGTNIPPATAASYTLSSISTADAGSYVCVVSNAVNSATSTTATLTIAANTFTIMQYNLDGNSITGTSPTNWAATAPQVLAIGRQIIYLNPDIIMINEVPTAYKTQMTNWDCLTNYPYQGTNAAGDGFIQNYVASKYPIISTASHLHGSSLAAFGYTNSSSFTRDLYEAEIAVPGLAATLHVFQAHLKATTSSPQDDASKRAAEAAAISNYFVTVYLPGAAGSHPYTLSGDMNEDAFFPETNHYTSGHPLQSMASTATGLQMTDPVNPFTGSDDTESIRLPLDTRFDYILPCPSLFSNILSSQVFRTDKLSPVPSGLNANDDTVASDHIPVLMTFAVPSASAPFLGTDVVSVTNLAGTTATFSVIAGGGTPLSYQWHRGGVDLSNGGNVTGSTAATLSLTGVLAADAGSYSVTITNSIGSTNSSVATLTVIDPGISTQPTGQTIFVGGSAVLSANAAGTGTLTYQWRKGVAVLSNGGSLSGTTTTNLTVSSAASADAGSYTIAVTGTAGTTTSSNAVLVVVTPIGITTQPASRTNNATTTATFNVAVTGTSPAYQWYRNGTALTNGGNILGSTTATLSVTNVLAADAASYSVVITNAAGPVTSANATLTVIDPAFTLQPKDASAQTGGTAIFTATAGGTAPITYQWRKNAANLTDGGNITGSTTTALTVSSASATDAAQYTVVATGLGTVTSSSAVLILTTATGEIVQSGSGYTQTFDGMGTGTNLPPGWLISPAGTAAPTYQAVANFANVNQTASSGSPTTGGRYNWGNGTNTSDRAVGFLTSGSGYVSPNSLMAGFYNNTGGTITALALTFDYERYRTNTAAAAVTFFISLDGTNWTAQTAGDSGAFDTGASAYSFTGGTVISRSVNVTGLSIAAGVTYYVRWNFNTTGANSQGLGLDNVAVTATTSVVTPPSPPSLKTALSGNILSISWPTNGADGFALQTITNINTPNWLPAGSGSVTGTNYVVTVSTTNVINLYRLKK